MNTPTKNPDEGPEISIILPCRDEAEAIGGCLGEIKAVIEANGLSAEVIVVDNGSTDRSAEIVKEKAADFPALRLVSEKNPGYGKACLAGFAAARGTYLYMADADGTYDFAEIPAFIEKLRQGCDIVVGNRFAEPMGKGVMPAHRKYLGNPVLSGLVRLFFGVRIHDIHCGARALTKNALDVMALRASGMESASEMVVKAARRGLSIGEVPARYGKRLGTSKLRSVHDGWRHLRFILLYSPLYLFLVPGAFLAAVGLVSLAVLYFTSPTVFGVQLFVHPMFLSAMLVIVGWQLVIFSAFSKIYAITHLGEKNASFERLFRVVTLERAALAGALLALLGGIVYIGIFVIWIRSGEGSLDQIKNSVVALTAVVVGVQTFFSAFMLSILGIQEK